MFNLLDRWLNTTSVDVSQSRCLKSRYKRSSCQKCIALCPQRAVSFGQEIKIDDSTCNGCGICVNVCPTGAFELNNHSYTKLLSQIDNRGTIIFSCAESSSSGIKVPCVGFLSSSFLLSIVIARKKSVEINIRECQGCSNHSGLNVIHETVRNVRAMLNVLGMEAEIHLNDNDSLGASENCYSRRELFTLFRNRTASKVSDVIEIVNPPVLKDSYREQKIPEHRKLLQHYWPELSEQVLEFSSCFPFTQVEISQECDLCNVCVKACPAGALIKSENEKKVTLKHNIDFCVKCGLCSEICPRKAVKYPETVELSIFNRKLDVELKEFPKSHCGECGRDFIATKDSLLCNACSAKKQLADEFFRDIN